MTGRVLMLALLLFSGVLGLSWQMFARLTPDIDQVAIAGELEPGQRDRVLEVLAERRDSLGSLNDIQAALDGLPWVHHTEVTRRWPDRLIVRVVREEAIAYWNDDAFINGEGRVFASPHVAFSKLAQLYGPENTEREVMHQYQALAKALSRVGQTIETLRLDARGSWQFETADGFRVMLGKEDILERIQRFLYVVESVGLGSRLDEIQEIDTRYANGMAVSWRDASQELALAESDKTKRETRL